MITKFEDFINEDYNMGISFDTYNGPPITPHGDPGIGARGGTNGGIVASGMETRGDVTAMPERGLRHYNVKFIKRPKDLRKEKAIKKLKQLGIMSFDEFKETPE